MNNYNRRNRRGNRNSYRPYRGGRNFGRRNGNRRRTEQIDESRFIRHINNQLEIIEYQPEHDFQTFNINTTLKSNLLNKGYLKPTEIQDKAIPHILTGKDLLGIANTGTGKTMAFLLPTLEKIVKDNTTKILIVSPTRELANQINEEFNIISQNIRAYSVLCTGGNNIRKQISGIRRNPNAIIGTPGRIKDLMERKVLKLHDFNTVILDEADRMLDMGFVNDIKDIVSKLPKNRQSLFFSATMDQRVEKVINMVLSSDYIKISVKTGETSDNVEQDIVRIEKPEEKFIKLHSMLIEESFRKVLIFANTKRGVEKLSKTLRDKGLKADSIHGNKSQNQRQRAIDKFKSNQTDILVATDVAARGIDVPGVTHVINFQVPESYKDYTHRIGRTGRANQKGIALTFIEKY